MSLFSGVTGDIRYWQRQAALAVRRAKPGPSLVRAAVFVGGVMSLGLSLPLPTVGGWAFPSIMLLALATTFAPRSPLPTVLILISVAGTVVRTAGQPPDTLARLLLVAAAAYVVHTGSALSAVLPFDAIVAPGALARWFLRAGLVMVATGMIGTILVLMTGYLRQWHYLAILLFGLAVVTGIAALLVRLVRRN
jgi:hypothetical protein